MSAPKLKICLELGDQDDDGKFGATLEASFDLPFDGTDELRPLPKTPELEFEDLGELAEVVKNYAGLALAFAGKRRG